MIFKYNPLHKCIVFSLLASGTLSTISFSFAGELPPAPKSISDINQLFKLYLDLSINHYSTRQIVPIIVKNDIYYIQKSKLTNDFNISIPVDIPTSGLLTNEDISILGFSGENSDWLKLSGIPEIDYEYSSTKQNFNLIIPAEWMPTQMIGKDTWYKPEVAKSSLGLLNNYDFYSYKPYNGNITSSLFTEQRFFSPYGVLKNSGVYVKTKIDKIMFNNHKENNDGYKRYDTNWQYDNQNNATSFILGDVITGNKTTWGSSVRLGGLQVQRNYSTRPDLITYPLPQFKGQAALPSSVDLIINGQKTKSTEVQSGPFILNNLPFINGKGEAVIITTDAVGRQVATAVPFYISNTLLKPGLLDYSFSVGNVREDYGLKNFSYGKFASALDARYGVNDWFTAEGRTELTDNLQLLGLGSVLKIGNWGVLNSSFSKSWIDNSLLVDDLKTRSGEQYTVGYSYNRNRFGFSVNHSNRDSTYSDLSRIQNTNLFSINSNKSMAVNTYFASRKSGTFGVGYIETQANSFENKLMNLSWAPVLPSYMKGVSVSLSANHDFIENQWNGMFQLSIPLFHSNSTVNTGFTLDSKGDSGYINYNQGIPTEGGFGFDITKKFNENHSDINQARFSYRNKYLNSDFGVSGNNDYNYWMGFSGSLVYMQNSLYAANRLGESFALIDTNNVPDVQVRYENNLIGRSNKKGHIFIPSVTPYYAGKYSVDPIDLPSNYTITNVENRVAAQRGSGIVIQFPIKKSHSANIYLILENNQPVPTGAVVHRSDFESSYVGMDGIVYLENLEKDNLITVQLSDQSTCKAKFSVDLEKAKEQILDIKSVLCLDEIKYENTFK